MFHITIFILGEIMENELGMQFCRIKGGMFHMGASPDDPDANPDEKPTHNVVLSDFYMGVFPVTRGQFAEFVKNTGYLGSCRYGSIDLLRRIAEHGNGIKHDPSSHEILRNIENWLGIQREEYELDYSSYDKELREEMIYFRDLHKNQRENPSAPVIQVSYEDADEFCKWLTSNFPGRYMLPTEAQWEYCCRSGTTTRFSWGDEPKEEYANFGRKKMLTKQEAYAANKWGLLDMHGNVWELCQDIYWPEYYKDLPEMAMNPLQISADYKMIEKISGKMDVKNLSSMQLAVIAASGDFGYGYTTAMATRRVVRGGSCASSGKECRSSQRETADKANPVGFRCIWVPDEVR
jgi:formylglycine-generating enzyme required for sulfatase activity